MIPDEQGIDLVSLEAMQHEATLALALLAKMKFDAALSALLHAVLQSTFATKMDRRYGRRSPARLDVSSDAPYPPLARRERSTTARYTCNRAITAIKSRRASGTTTGGTIQPDQAKP